MIYDLPADTNDAWEQLSKEECLFMDEATLDRLFRVLRPRGYYRLHLNLVEPEPTLRIEPWPRLSK